MLPRAAEHKTAAAPPACRLVLVMVDGLGDVGYSRLSGRTPLQAARKPSLDLLAAHGLCGLMDPVEAGLACGSDTAHLSMLGVDPLAVYRGRGALETMGSGLDMAGGDVAFKSVFAVLDEETQVVTSRRADPKFHEWGPPLCEYLSGSRLPGFPDVEVAVKYATEHRCGVRLRGPGLSDEISGTDPLKDGLPLLHSAPLDAANAAACRTSQVVNEMHRVFHDQLRRHPLNKERLRQGKPAANVVLFRGPSARLEGPTFHSLHGLRAFMIAPTAIIAGVGQCLSMDLVSVDGATGDYRSDLAAKARTASQLIIGGDYDFGFVHVKMVDDAGHDKDIDLKIKCIERVDAMVGQLLSNLAAAGCTTTQYYVAVTGDHSTPALSGDHSCEPVPFVISRLPLVCQVAGADPPSPRSFDEVGAASGALGRFPGHQMMPLIKSLLFGP